jgi:hypothetical protein
MLLQKWFGARGTAWTLTRQALVQADGKTFDLYEVALADGAQRQLYFDVTELLRLRG